MGAKEGQTHKEGGDDADADKLMVGGAEKVSIEE